MELHRCLKKREFQVLVLPWPHRGCTFGRKPLERFVEAFVCPVVAVGPETPYVLTLNPPAGQLLDQLGLAAGGGWSLADRSLQVEESGCGVAAPVRLR